MKALLTIFVALAASLPAPVRPDGPAGGWFGWIAVPGQVELEELELSLENGEGDGWTGVVSGSATRFTVAGKLDAGGGALELAGELGGQKIVFELEVADTALSGSMRAWGGTVPIHVTREAPEEAPPPQVVDLAVERPLTVSMKGLDDGRAEEVTIALRRVADEKRVVGISLAVVIDGKIVDVRSLGWEDFGRRVPATDETMYRWASISKPLTAVAALQLAVEGKLDLDADVREYVPEFPKKRHAFTARQLLCHQAGIVHYNNMRVRTVREYEVEHPWADRVLALDMFNDSDLLHEPGTKYHYTTPGYSILGAVIERAADTKYVLLIAERILRPLGMKTMRPDYMWEEIPHRARGYHRTGEDVIDSGDNDISWKLPAGGWISTVGDLARFGIGLIENDLLDAETRRAMFTRQATTGDEKTGYGLGIGVGEWKEQLTVSHSGGQLKTSTFLLVLPERKAAVALMCNTQGAGLGDLAYEILGAAVGE